MRALVDQAVDTFGRLDAAFNNATDGPMPAPLADIETSSSPGIRTNVQGTFLSMKYEIACSAAAEVPSSTWRRWRCRATVNLAAYVAGKAAIIGLTEVAALDYADRAIRVNVVAPGPIPPTASSGRVPRRSDLPASPSRWAHREHCGGR